MKYYSSSEWERALTPVHNHSAIEYVPKGQILSPVLKYDPGEVRGVIRRGSKYIIYWDRNDVKVAPVTSIPLDFNKRYQHQRHLYTVPTKEGHGPYLTGE